MTIYEADGVEVGQTYNRICKYPISDRFTVTDIVTTYHYNDPFPGIKIIGKDELENVCSMSLAMLLDCYELEST